MWRAKITDVDWQLNAEVLAMVLEVEATYENGVLKLDKPLPLGGRDPLEYLLGPDNQPW